MRYEVPDETLRRAAPSHYDILEVAPAASMETIRLAYASLAERTRKQSDTPEVQERLRQLETAFVVLSDANLRSKYDAALAATTQEKDDGRRRRSEVEALFGPPRAEPPYAEMSLAAYERGAWSGFWRRFAAYWIDGVLLCLPLAAVLLGGMSAIDPKRPYAVLAVYVLMLGLVVAWHGLFISGAKLGTPGRRFLGIGVVDARNGAPLGRARAVARSALSVVSYLLILPNLAMLFTRRRQTVADLIAQTAVVQYKATGTASRLILAVCALLGIGTLSAIAIPQYHDYVLRARVREARADLDGYAQTFEDFWRSYRMVPPALDILVYKPKSRSARYSLGPQGQLRAIIPGVPGATKSQLGLDPWYDQAADKLNWPCGASEIPERYLPVDCRSHELSTWEQ